MCESHHKREIFCKGFFCHSRPSPSKPDFLSGSWAGPWACEGRSEQHAEHVVPTMNTHECVLLLYNNRHLFNSYRQLSTCIFMFIYLQLSNIHVCIYVHLFTTFYDYTVHMIHVFMYVHLFTVSSTIWWTTVASCMIGNSRWTNQCHQVFQCLHLWPKQ